MKTDTATLPTPTLILEEVAAHLEYWRKQKQRGERIPAQLGSDAIALVESYGLSQVTRRLRLSGRDLNRHRGIIGGGRRRSADMSVGFVELEPAAVAQAQCRASMPASLELIRPDGLRLRI